MTASEGLQPYGRAERRAGTSPAPQAGRILIVHNDPARVAALSAAAWRDDAASLIAVPVPSRSHVNGTIEVVGVKTRRSTEWEIALAQVVAAQVGGRLRDDLIFGADAVA
jgi:GAF domain-containing protein